MGLVKAPPQTAEQDVIPRGRAELLIELKDGTPNGRRSAASTLAWHADTVSILIERLAEEPDRAVRVAIGTSLVTLADLETPFRIAPLLESSDATVRNDTRELLLLLPGAERVAWELLNHTDASVRVFAAEILVYRLGPAAAECIADRLGREHDVNACAELIERLAAVGSPRHFPALDAVARRFADSEFLGFAVAEARRRLLLAGTTSPPDIWSKDA